LSDGPLRRMADEVVRRNARYEDLEQEDAT
jgi:hypothetical protein